jgi:site-specific DNA-cytosine methylase
MDQTVRPQDANYYLQQIQNLALTTAGQDRARNRFPDTWHFAGRKTAAYRQVGNAFPPPRCKSPRPSHRANSPWH